MVVINVWYGGTMAKPLDQLSETEFKKAYEQFQKTEAQVEKNAALIQGVWEPVREKIREARNSFEQECKRRHGGACA